MLSITKSKIKMHSMSQVQRPKFTSDCGEKPKWTFCVSLIEPYMLTQNHVLCKDEEEEGKLAQKRAFPRRHVFIGH